MIESPTKGNSMARGYRLRKKEWQWVVKNVALFKEYAKELADKGKLDDASHQRYKELMSLCNRLVRTGLVRPQDRPGFIQMLLAARQEQDQRSRGRYITAENRFVETLLKHLSGFDWEALDEGDESTYVSSQLWRGFRRTENELYYLLVDSDSRVMCTCTEGYDALEPGARISLVVNDNDEDDGYCGPGDVYEIEVIRTRMCVEDGASHPDQPTKMFEAIIVAHPQGRERRPDDGEMSGLIRQDGLVLMLPSSPLSRYSQEVYSTSVWCATHLPDPAE